MKISIVFLTFKVLIAFSSDLPNKTSIETHFLGDLEAHISSRTKTKSSITRAVIDLLNPNLNKQLFFENGNTATLIFENIGVESTQREQHDLIYAILHSVNGEYWLKFYLLRAWAVKTLPRPPYLQRRSLNIFLVDNYESFLKIYEGLKDVDFENDSYYLVILNYLDEDWSQVAKKIFAKAWERYMINTTLMFMSNMEDVVKIFTYFPYAESHCERVEPILIQEIREGKWGTNETIFPKKLRNFHGCTVKIALLNVPPLFSWKRTTLLMGSKRTS